MVQQVQTDNAKKKIKDKENKRKLLTEVPSQVT